MVACLVAVACAGGVAEETTSTSVADLTTSTSEATTTVTTAASASSSTTAATPSTTTSTTVAAVTTVAPSTTAATTSTTSPPTTTTTVPASTTTTAAPSGPAVIEVATGDDYFAPVNIVISVGDAVRWRNVGSEYHTTTSGSRPTPSGVWDAVLDVGETYTRTFDTPGTFNYFCLIHVGQNGKVTVNP
jgi:plastocyanin